MRRLSIQQKSKLIEKKCQICKIENYALLDAHRIVPGVENGKYTSSNILVICSNCHRKIHAGDIEILSKSYSTSGNYVVRYLENGVEKFA